MRLRFCLSCCLLCIFASCSTQKDSKSGIKITKTVSGIVMDENGPLPGATIIVKNERKGTYADMDGKFEISINENDILVVGFIGLESKEVAITSKDCYEVHLEAFKPIKPIESRKQKRRIRREMRKNGYYIYPD